MIDQLARRAFAPHRSGINAKRAFGGERQVAFGEPRRIAVEPHCRAGKKLGREAAAMFRIGEAPARRRRIQRDAEAHIPRRGHRSRDTERGGEGAGHIVGAVMAAEKRHHRAAVLGQRDHRRLVPLVAEHGRQRADQDRRCADTYDRHAIRKQSANMRRQNVEPDIRLGQAGAKGMDFCTGQRALRRLRGLQTAQTEHDDGGRRAHFHARLRLCTRIIEKYGTSSAVTRSSASAVCSGRVACAI